MKKLFLISSIAVVLILANINIFAQYAAKYELKNIVQTTECEIRFDVYVTNMSSNPSVNYIAIEGAQFQVSYNAAMLNGGGINKTYLTFVPGTSDFDPLSTSTYPISGYVTSVAAGIQWANQVNIPGDVLVYLGDNLPLRIGTFKLILKTGTGTTISKNFASVAPTLALVPAGCKISTTPATLTDVSVDQDGSLMRYTRDGSSFTQINTISLANATGVKDLYSYAYTGTGDFSVAANWNTSLTTHIVPTDVTANISIGKLSTATVPVATPGVCTISSNQTFKDITIKGTSTLTLGAGKQLSVNGTIYKENAANSALTLKSDATGTASLLNNTAAITATIERYIPAWTTIAGWHLLSSPVASQLIATNFTDATPANYDFFKYDNTVALCWKNFKSGGFTTFTPGVGYLASYATAGVHTFAGTLKNEGITAPTVTFNAFPGTGWNLLGNPYTCAIDAGLVTKTNVETTIHVLDATNNTYKNYNGVTGTFNGEIPAMQGFFVHATSAGAAVTIPTTAKKHSTNAFYKTTTLDNQLKLNVLSPNATSDVAIIYFKNDNINGVDIYDGSFMPSGNTLNTQIYSYINSDKYCIDALGEYTAPISVNLGFEPKVDGNFTITAGEIQSFNTASTIILQDLKTGTTQNLRTNPTYNFTASTTDVVNRFIVLFDLAPTGINNAKLESNNIYSYENNIYVKTNDVVKSVSVYNMLGQEVVNFQQPTSKVLTINQTSGYYTVRVITNSNVYSQKVYIK